MASSLLDNLNPEQHDAIMGSVPTVRARVRQDRLARNGCPFFHGFRIFSLADQLLSLALECGWNVVLQANVRPRYWQKG